VVLRGNLVLSLTFVRDLRSRNLARKNDSLTALQCLCDPRIYPRAGPLPLMSATILIKPGFEAADRAECYESAPASCIL
jgi:hypothetical protein